MHNRYIHISDEQFAEAEANGIQKTTVTCRVTQLGWNIEDAITKPVREYGKHGEWAKVAEATGISKPTFYKRISNGMTAEEAATKPTFDRSTHNMWDSIRQRKISKEAVAKAAENGVSYYVLRDRIVNGMDESIACMKIEDIKGKFTDEKVEVGDTVKVVGLGNSNVLYLVMFISVSGLVTLQKYGFKRKRHVQYKHLRHFEIVKQDQN